MDSDLLLPVGGALAEGFHERLREFQMFERTFEVQKDTFDQIWTESVSH